MPGAAEAVDLRDEPERLVTLAALSAVRELGRGEARRLLTRDDPALLMASLNLQLRDALAWETAPVQGHLQSTNSARSRPCFRSGGQRSQCAGKPRATRFWNRCVLRCSIRLDPAGGRAQSGRGRRSIRAPRSGSSASETRGPPPRERSCAPRSRFLPAFRGNPRQTQGR